MRAVVQRVKSAKVTVDENTVGQIGGGFLVLLGVCDADDDTDLQYMADKILGLRVFEDAAGKMNLSLGDVEGELLVVSQFTLYGDCRKGRRPSFDKAGKPEHANQLYEKFLDYCTAKGFRTQHGIFGADMQVELVNDGPVTLLLDSKKLF